MLRHPISVDLAVLCTMVVACASAPPVGQRNLLAFLTPGVTTRAEVVERLGGKPSAAYESGRIVAYRIDEDEAGYLMGGKQPARYSLVLVFGADDVLSRHSLVKVRER